MSWYYMSLENGIEFINVSGDHAYEQKAGTALIAFCDVDWLALERQCEDAREYKKGGDVSLTFAELYLSACEAVCHPLIKGLFICQLIGDMKSTLMELGSDPKGPEWDYVLKLEMGELPEKVGEELPRMFLRQLSTRFHEFEDVRSRLVPMIDEVLNVGIERGGLTILQRYSLFRRESMDYLVLSTKLYPLLKYEFRVTENGKVKEFLPNGKVGSESIEIVKSSRLDCRFYQTTDSLAALMLWEFDYMASKEIPVRRCDHCNRLFLPYSVASRYCERPVEDKSDKTCKDIGASTKHQREVNNDAAKALYKKVNNRVQTAAKRYEINYPDIKRIAYKRWQFSAQQLLEQVEAGTMDYDAFADAIDRSPRELLGMDGKGEKERSE